MIGDPAGIASLLPPTVPTAPASGDTREAAEQFEALLVQQLLKEIPLPGLEGTQAETMMSFVHEALAKEIVASGGLGLADQLEQGMAGRVRPTRPNPMPIRHEPLPLPHGAPARVSSGYGWRTDPIHGRKSHHDGLDLSAPAGTPIVAAAAGTVKFAGTSGGYGNLVVLDHGDGTESRYAHCSVLEVREGQAIAAGEAIAKVGSTGRSTGPHLHFEVRKDGTTIDPSALLDGSKGWRLPIREEPQPFLDGGP